MSALRHAMSHAVLGWVKPELDETLRKARAEIEAHVEAAADGGHMRACAAYLHGYAAAQASQSDQRGFTPPTIYGSDDRHLRTKLGHPIVASDVIGMIPATFAELLS